MRTLVAAILGVGLVAAGCSRAHISPGFGRANQEAFAMQEPPLAKPPPTTNMTLDTQEAEVISQGYFKSLAGKTKSSGEPDPVLYVAPGQQRQTGMPLAPSVPQN
jgi:hypothetical protein